MNIGLYLHVDKSELCGNTTDRRKGGGGKLVLLGAELLLAVARRLQYDLIGGNSFAALLAHFHPPSESV